MQVVSLESLNEAEDASVASEQAPSADTSDQTSDAGWDETLALAQQVASSALFTRDRVAELEKEGSELEHRLEKEVQALRARLCASEKLLERIERTRAIAEERAVAAEARAESAESYLEQIATHFRRIQTPSL